MSAGAGRCLALLLALTSAGAARAVAQEREPDPPEPPPAAREAAPAVALPGHRGWIGVGLQHQIICDQRERPPRRARPNPCRPSVVVETVFPGSPAERAGIQPGDTLLSAGGTEPPALAFTPGEPVRLLVGRGGGRTPLEVVPEERPPRSVRRASPAAPSPPEARPRLRVVRLGDGRSLYVSRPGAIDTLPAALPEAPRLEAVAETVLARARAHWDSIREIHRVEIAERTGQVMESSERLAERSANLEEWNERMAERTAAVSERMAELGARMARLEPEANEERTRIHRLAGAEFLKLPPGLAEYFPDAGRGLLVIRVLRDTPAHRLGLRPGDVMVEAAGTEISGPAPLREALIRRAQGESTEVKWIRKGKEMQGVIPR